MDAKKLITLWFQSKFFILLPVMALVFLGDHAYARAGGGSNGQSGLSDYLFMIAAAPFLIAYAVY